MKKKMLRNFFSQFFVLKNLNLYEFFYDQEAA